MQKINFLPQVKVWNAVEFGVRNHWPNPEVEGLMTYDGSLHAFMVTIPGKSNVEWRRILVTPEGDHDYSGKYVKEVYLNNAQNDSSIPFCDGLGNVHIYTQSIYSSSNKLATMQDVSNAISNVVVEAYIDTTSIVDDSSTIHLYSDPSSLYNASTNQLATIGTVNNIVANIGNVLELRRVYDPSTITFPTTYRQDFFGWLAYCNDDASGSPSWDYYLHDEEEPHGWNVEKGDVVIWGNEEYVYIGVNPREQGYDPDNEDNWELFGKLDIDAAVTSFAGATGAIEIDSQSFYMSGQMLKLHPASDNTLGGVTTGYEYTHKDVSYGEGDSEYSQRYGQFGLDMSEDASTINQAFTDIPFQTGHVEAGLLTLRDYTILQNISTNGVFVAATLVDPSSFNTGNYNSIFGVRIQHDFGQAVMQVSVYKNMEPGRDSNNNIIIDSITKQMVYADEIIAGPNEVRIDFGSSQAFIGCQDSDVTYGYYGYTVVMTVPSAYVHIPDSSLIPVYPSI